MPEKYLGPIYLALAASIWGGMYVVSKVVLDVVAPLELLWLRYVVALATLGAIGAATSQDWRIRRQDWPLIVLIGATGYFISLWAQFAGTRLSSAQMGSVITSATPAFMVLFARLLLREKITLRKGISVILATVGVLFIVGVGDVGDASKLGGVILAVAALTWALMSVMVKKVPGDYSLLVVTTYAIAVATVLVTPLAAGPVLAKWTALTQPVVWGGVLYLGIVSTAAAFYLWNKGLQMVDAAGGGLYFFFQPLVGTLLGWSLLGEEVGASFWLGAALILGGVAFVLKE